MISKLSETHSIESHVRETVAFGKPFVLKMSFMFIKRDENGYPIILGLMGGHYTNKPAAEYAQ